MRKLCMFVAYYHIKCANVVLVFYYKQRLEKRVENPCGHFNYICVGRVLPSEAVKLYVRVESKDQNKK